MTVIPEKYFTFTFTSFTCSGCFDPVLPSSLQGSSGGVHAADADRMEEERGAGGPGAAPGRQGEGLPGPIRPQRKEGKFSAVRVGY